MFKLSRPSNLYYLSYLYLYKFDDFDLKNLKSDILHCGVLRVLFNLLKTFKILNTFMLRDL